MRGLGWVALVVLSGCISTRDRGGADWSSRAATYKTPEVLRCAKFKPGGGPAAACAEAKYLGEVYVRKLATGDEVCLEGGFGDEPTSACQARATIVDTATNKLLVEIRKVRPESKWFSHEQTQFWFEEGALVDLYVAEHGY
ncbi:MAG: hypothetical protein Q8L48_09645 [Archangium sp.]|nr:hypothetical protein [Archangium sp.]